VPGLLVGRRWPGGCDATDVRHTVNGSLSLSDAREHYSRCGAAHPGFLPYVRKALVTEQ